MFDAEYNDKTKIYSIKGFTVTVTAANEKEMKEKADKEAEQGAQILTLKRLSYVKHRYEGYSRRTSRGTKLVAKQFIVRYNIQASTIDELNLNSNQAISPLMQKDKDFKMQTYHFYRAMEAEENRQYANMYRELFQVIEKEKEMPWYKKYKSLRDAVSHQDELKRAMPKVQKYFDEERYDFTENKEFDHSSKKNREHLKEDAGNLKKLVISYLKIKLQ